MKQLTSPETLYIPRFYYPGSVDGAIDRMVTEPLPGVQFKPLPEHIDTVLDHIQTAVQRYLPGYRYNETRDIMRKPDMDKGGLHFDFPPPAGVAVHVNNGRGQVQLFMGKEFTTDMNDPSVSLEDRDKYLKWVAERTVGPRYVGELDEDSVITVFSEGILTPTVDLKPAAHSFRRTRFSTRTVRTYRYIPQKQTTG